MNLKVEKSKKINRQISCLTKEKNQTIIKLWILLYFVCTKNSFSDNSCKQYLRPIQFRHITLIGIRGSSEL